MLTHVGKWFRRRIFCSMFFFLIFYSIRTQNMHFGSVWMVGSFNDSQTHFFVLTSWQLSTVVFFFISFALYFFCIWWICECDRVNVVCCMCRILSFSPLLLLFFFRFEKIFWFVAFLASLNKLMPMYFQLPTRRKETSLWTREEKNQTNNNRKSEYLFDIFLHLKFDETNENWREKRKRMEWKEDTGRW